MQTVMHEYVRERIPVSLRTKGETGKTIVGVMVATVVDGVIKVGWSKANLKAGDVFDKEAGIKLALDRANGLETVPAIPSQMVPQYRALQMRALSYFKQATFAPLKEQKVCTCMDNDKQVVVKDDQGVDETATPAPVTDAVQLTPTEVAQLFELFELLFAPRESSLSPINKIDDINNPYSLFVKGYYEKNYSEFAKDYCEFPKFQMFKY